MADNIRLDLDALAPKAVLIQFQGKSIEVQPLSVEQFAQFAQLSDTMQRLKGKEGEPEAFLPVYKQMVEFISSAIPELANVRLNVTQLIKLFELLSEISAPQDSTVAELEARGITITKDTGGPKDASTS